MNVYVFGLGHIGLPLSAFIAIQGHYVQGIDINEATINDIKNGIINIYEYYEGRHISTIASDLINKKVLNVSTQYKRVDREPSVFIITVGLNTNNDNSQDISPLQKVLNEIIPTLVPHDLFLFRTTMIPGTCEKIIYPELKKLNIPIHLAYCPETISETHAFEEFEKNNKILAAVDEESYSIAESFLNSLSNSPIYKASSITTAELAKVVQNLHRDVNIAFSNEIAEAASKLEVNIYELEELVNTHPRVNMLTPGPGVGGYCLPNALNYLRESLTNENISLPLVNISRQINNEKPYKVVNLVKKALMEHGKNIKNSSVAVIGLAMKDFCADCRLSPSLDIISILLKEGAKVRAFDPEVNLIHPFQVKSMEECMEGADCMLILVNQHAIYYDIGKIINVMNKPTIVVDAKNVFENNEKINLYKI